jgi:ribonucleoside-diphosphate reductase beta chain
MSIFDNEIYLNNKYSFLDKYVSIMYRGFWTPAKYEKLIHEVDAPYFHNNMNEVDKEVVRRCILAIAMVEDKVKSFWSTLHMELPQTVISDVGALFGMSETTHRRSYHSLAEEIGVDIKDIEKHAVLRDRLSYLNKHLERDPKIIGKKRTLKKLILFTSLVERGSLFTQFYILMSYAKNNKGLKTISALQQSTATEEIVHYNFGMDVINIIKQEHPQLWEEYLIELIEKNLMMAYETELRLINWFFQKGTPDHLTKKEVVNFLNYNFNIIANDLDLNLKFDCDSKLYNEKSEWMLLKLHSSEPDFFDNAVGGYASEDEDIDIDNFEF